MKTSFFRGLAVVTVLAGFGAGCAANTPPSATQPAITPPTTPAVVAPTPSAPSPTTPSAGVTKQDLDALKQDVQSLRIDDVSSLKQ